MTHSKKHAKHKLVNLVNSFFTVGREIRDLRFRGQRGHGFGVLKQGKAVEKGRGRGLGSDGGAERCRHVNSLEQLNGTW